MSKRQEFPPRVKLAIYQRAGGPDKVRCEKCYAAVKGRRFEIDHKVADWITRDRDDRKELTIDDGWLLGIDCGCHKVKTAREAGERAKGKRITAKAANAAPKRTSRPLMGTKASGWKHTLSGEWVKR